MLNTAGGGRHRVGLDGLSTNQLAGALERARNARRQVDEYIECVNSELAKRGSEPPEIA